MAGFFIGNKWDVYNGFPSNIIAPFYSLRYGIRSSCSDFFNCFDLSTVPTVILFEFVYIWKLIPFFFKEKKNGAQFRNKCSLRAEMKTTTHCFERFEEKKIIVCDTLLMKCQVPTQVSLTVETLNLSMSLRNIGHFLLCQKKK